MLRVIDFFAALTGLIILCPFLLILFIVGLFDTGSPLFLQKRMGRYKTPFTLIKFRTMHRNTKSVPSHFASNSSITKWGSVLRRTKLDELPQLWNVLIGDMSLVGPRPNLLDQKELIYYRSAKDIYSFRPGITGLAQIYNIDMSKPQALAKVDHKMMQNLSLKNYFFYLYKTISGSGKGDAITKQ